MKNIKLGDYSQAMTWQKYHSVSEDWLRIPEIAAVEMSKIIPSYIKNILNFGCSSGRDFIPFQGRGLDFHGFDICPDNVINWICDTERLTYYCCNIQDFPIYHGKSIDIDLSKSFVYTSGTMMYVDTTNQNKFIDYLIEHGCKNMCFQEYAPPKAYENGSLYLNEKNLLLFTKKEYRIHIPAPIQPFTFYMIDEGK